MGIFGYPFSFRRDYMKVDTIAAIATALTPSGIGIIRISGEDSLAIINRIFYGKTKKKELPLN